MAPRTTLSTTETSIDVLETIQQLNGAGVTEIADALDLATSTAHKHLVTLHEAGYLIKEGTTYHVGLKLLSLGEYARQRRPEHRRAAETVDVLTTETREEVDFVVEEHGRIVTISESYHEQNRYGEVDSRSAPTARARVGTYYHMHSTAAGKAILAALPEEHVSAIVDRWGLPANTENTITDRDRLSEELRAVRERGYAIDDQEFTEGLRSVGMAVTDPLGSPIGGFSVSGPAYRLDDTTIKEEISTTLAGAIETFESDIETLWPTA